MEDIVARVVDDELRTPPLGGKAVVQGSTIKAPCTTDSQWPCSVRV